VATFAVGWRAARGQSAGRSQHNETRVEPLEKRKTRLQKVLANAGAGIQYVEYIEGDGPAIFDHACRMNLEGIVLKRRDLPYQSGRSKTWLKIKNPASPAMLRLQEDGAW
jgi:ATP-dependent DNA ligase